MKGVKAKLIHDVYSQLSLLLIFLRREVNVRSYLRDRYTFPLMTALSEALLFLILASLRETYYYHRVSYASALFIAMLPNALFATLLSLPYSGLSRAYWSGRLESFLALGVRPYIITIGFSIGILVDLMMRIGILSVIGAFMNLYIFLETLRLEALLIIFLASLACLGLGSIEASMFILVNAKGGQGPIRYFITVLVSLLSGLYFPVQMLPKTLQYLSLALPQTYAFDGLRRVLLKDGSNMPRTLLIHLALDSYDPVALNILFLALLSLAFLTIGLKLHKISMNLGMKSGSLTSPF